MYKENYFVSKNYILINACTRMKHLKSLFSSCLSRNRFFFGDRRRFMKMSAHLRSLFLPIFLYTGWWHDKFWRNFLIRISSDKIISDPKIRGMFVIQPSATNFVYFLFTFFRNRVVFDKSFLRNGSLEFVNDSNVLSCFF